MSDKQSTAPGEDIVAALRREIAELRDRVRELEDDREIRELMARYAFLADQGLDEAFVDLFTDDGEMDLVAPGFYSGVQRWQGPERLLTFISGRERNPAQPDPHAIKAEGRRMHAQGNNLRTYIDGDTAVAESYSLVLTRSAGDGTDVEGGSNRWTFRRVDGRWKISGRMRRPMGSPTYHDPFVTKA